MILYHGTNTDIQMVDLKQSKVGKDFGLGFYLTPDYSSAVRQAHRRADISGGSPILLTYEYNESEATLLRTICFEGYTRQWAEFVKANRDNRTHIQIHDYDIVIGPIANDDIGMQMRRFKAKEIDIDEFLKLIQYKKVILQYFFSTQAAIQLLTKTGVTKL